MSRGDQNAPMVQLERAKASEAHMRSLLLAEEAENRRLREQMSYLSGHDRSGLDHLAESEAWRLAVEQLRSEAATGRRPLDLLAVYDEVERRHHDILEAGGGR
jgi:hypothetical protein